jgi:ABC-type lipoprotein export system ATPase subunit
MTALDGPPLVRCRAVTRTFGVGSKAVKAVDDITCDIHAGEQIAISGPSGSGKSTLLFLMAGLVDPTAGSVTWPAIGDIGQLRPGPVAIVLQGPSLLPPLTVVENVALPLVLYGMPHERADALATAALDRFDLASLTDKLPEEVSGGQAQRIAVARALAGRPSLILADEPTGQLDRAAATLVIDALIDVADQLNATLIVTTHDQHIADRLEQRWLMVDGAIVSRRAVLQRQR